jgi:CheY-like chemotaxis protein
MINNFANKNDYKVLIVDDIPKNIMVLGNNLMNENYQIAYCRSGQEAIDLTQKNDFDLILMDVMMPEMDGYTATQKIRQSEKHKDLPVIILTAKAMKEDKEKALKSGASDYLTKPVDVDKMISLIRVWLYK